MKVLISSHSDITHIQAMLTARGIDADVVLIDVDGIHAPLERDLTKIPIARLPEIENPTLVDDNRQWWKKFDKKRKRRK